MKTMVIDGVHLVEAPAPAKFPPHLSSGVCKHCALHMTAGCGKAIDGLAHNAFGGDCEDRDVIYIRSDRDTASERLQQFGSM
mgnify:CR=1 FL=1